MKVIQVCLGPTCSFLGGAEVLKAFEYSLSLREGEVDFLRRIKLEKKNCFGLCQKGPNVCVGGEFHHYMRPGKVTPLVKALLAEMEWEDWYCPHCGHSLEKQGKLCLLGEKGEEEYQISPEGRVKGKKGGKACPHCGFPLLSANLCPQCGRELLELMSAHGEVWICLTCLVWRAQV